MTINHIYGYQIQFGEQISSDLVFGYLTFFRKNCISDVIAEVMTDCGTNNSDHFF